MIERLLAAEAALARGELDHAERLFAQVAEADARNAIALVGLARVASRQGRTEEARNLVHRALELDPDEAAARRLLVGLDAAAAPKPLPPTHIAPAPEAPGADSPVEAAPNQVAPAARPSLIDRLLHRLGFRRGG